MWVCMYVYLFSVDEWFEVWWDSWKDRVRDVNEWQNENKMIKMEVSDVKWCD